MTRHSSGAGDITVKLNGGRYRSRFQPESLFRPLQRGVSSWRSPLISQRRNLSASPSSPRTDTFRRSPPDTSRNLERLTQT
ncbi:hypothetical protein [Parathermosynechococcus lividus]|uniref:hypothetical protein n=1 Tax=Parathermosynechococcus lividus TaxID=33070 RepID=UPI0012FD9536|nr:hypothetical protein [Thermostichus lividus]